MAVTTHEPGGELVPAPGRDVGADHEPVQHAVDGDDSTHTAEDWAGAVVLPGPVTQPAVELVRWRVEHGRWPTLDDVTDEPEGAVLIGRRDLTGSVLMPDDPAAAWAMWVDAEAERRDAEAERRHAELLARLEEAQRTWRQEWLPALQAAAAVNLRWQSEEAE